MARSQTQIKKNQKHEEHFHTVSLVRQFWQKSTKHFIRGISLLMRMYRIFWGGEWREYTCKYYLTGHISQVFKVNIHLRSFETNSNILITSMYIAFGFALPELTGGYPKIGCGFCCCLFVCLCFIVQL